MRCEKAETVWYVRRQHQRISNDPLASPVSETMAWYQGKRRNLGEPAGSGIGARKHSTRISPRLCDAWSAVRSIHIIEEVE